jgi:hypothetical protein
LTEAIEATHVIYAGARKIMTVSPETIAWMLAGGYVEATGQEQYQLTSDGLDFCCLPYASLPDAED